MRRWLPALLAALLLAGCGGDGDGPFGSGVVGAWDFTKLTQVYPDFTLVQTQRVKGSLVLAGSGSYTSDASYFGSLTPLGASGTYTRTEREVTLAAADGTTFYGAISRDGQTLAVPAYLDPSVTFIYEFTKH